MCDSEIKTLYEFPYYLNAEILPDNESLLKAYEYEHDATIGMRQKVIERDRIHWDLDRKNRKPNTDILVVIAAILKSEEHFLRLLDYAKRKEEDHVNAQMDAGCLREDVGFLASTNTLIEQLVNTGIQLLRYAGKNKLTDSIVDTLLAFKEKYFVQNEPPLKRYSYEEEHSKKVF
jgi:hypothetical protein